MGTILWHGRSWRDSLRPFGRQDAVWRQPIQVFSITASTFVLVLFVRTFVPYRRIYSVVFGWKLSLWARPMTLSMSISASGWYVLRPIPWQASTTQSTTQTDHMSIDTDTSPAGRACSSLTHPIEEPLMDSVGPDE